MHPFLLVLLAFVAMGAFQLGRQRALALAGGTPRALHSHPRYHGYFVAIWCGLPALLLVIAWTALGPGLVDSLVVRSLPAEVQGLAPERLEALLGDARNLAEKPDASRAPGDPALDAAARYRELRSTADVLLLGLVSAVATAGLVWGRRRLHAGMRAREAVERLLMVLLVASSTVAILTTIGIVLSLVFEAARFFARVPVQDFLFGLQWSPQTALRADQVGSSGAFGAVPVFTGTLLVTAIAMSVAAPLGFMSAVFLSEYAGERVRGVVKPLLEVLAGIPTVVYGFFAALSVGPLVRSWGETLGLAVSSESALAAGLVMGVMIIPFVSSLSDDVIHAVPQALREGSLALGATRSETIRRVVVPAALPGIIGALLLAVSRAIGETMIVVMAAGLAANLTANPLEAVTTVTVQIVTLLVGDQEFDSAKTLSAFALGLVLFCVTLVLNAIALHVVNRYREQYE